MSRYHLRNTRGRKRGSILILTLLFLTVIALFAVAFWNIVPAELHSAKKQMIETEAYFASDAGIVDSLAFLEKITADGNIDNYVNNNGVINAQGHKVIQRSGTVNSWTWQVEIIPGPETFGHAGSLTPNPLRVYQIVSAAQRPGTTTSNQTYRKVSCWVKQKSFAKNNWANMATAGTPLWLFMDTFKLGGDYHTNGKGLLTNIDSSFWSKPEAVFKGDFTFAKESFFGNGGDSTATSGEFIDGVCYGAWGDDNVPFELNGAQRGQAIPGRYEKISAQGRAGVRWGDQIQMPLNTDSVAFGVWGSTPPTAPLTNAQMPFGASSVVKATINGASPGSTAQNGLYIDGDVSQIDFSTDEIGSTPTDPSDDNQVIRIYQGTSTTQYLEVVHVSGHNVTIPASTPAADVQGSTPGANLAPTANGGKGYTILKNVNGSSVKYAVYNEQTNGAIFSTGNVNGVRGRIKGRRTVGVSTDTGSATAKDKTILINGDLTYDGTPLGDKPTSADTMLGLIGYAVRVTADPASAAPTLANPQIGKVWPNRKDTSTASPLYLYTSIFAGRRNDPKANLTGYVPINTGGGFGVVNPGDNNAGIYDGRTYKKGHMKLFGSITEGIRQHKGTGTVAGNSYEFDLDPNLAEIQPPFFPTLPSYDLLSWEEKSYFSY